MKKRGQKKAVFGDSSIFNRFSIFGEEMNKLHKRELDSIHQINENIREE